MQKFLKASTNPLDDINSVSYEGQPIENRMYKSGYENFFETMPKLDDNDETLLLKIEQSKTAMYSLANALKFDKWTRSLQPLQGGFNRTILALEAPEIRQDGTIKEGQEIILARWGDGKTSPIHGHGDGLLYEQLIAGTMRVNTYRITDHVNRIVRPIETKIYNGFTNIASSYTRKQQYERSALVHNFTSIGYSQSLHFVPEHTRDGRDNKFEVEYFDLSNYTQYPHRHLTQLNAQQGLEQLHPGDVALVRSENVPQYGDHFIVITGLPILKEHGLRPQDIAIHAPNAARLLNAFTPIMGLTLLKLDAESAKAFHAFHGITMQGYQVILPTT